MEKKKSSDGKNFSVGNRKIILDIQNEVARKVVIKKYSLTPTQYNFFKHIADNSLFVSKGGSHNFDYLKVKENGMGHKNSAYWTEEEMLNPPQYSWEELSAKEKQFYYNYTKNKKADWTDEEIKEVEFYFNLSTNNNVYSKWIDVKTIMDNSGKYPKRSIISYKNKMNKVWRSRTSSEEE